MGGGRPEAVEVGGRDRLACALGPTAAIGREGRRNRVLHRPILSSTYRWIKQSKHVSTAILPRVAVPQVRIAPTFFFVLSQVLV